MGLVALLVPRGDLGRAGSQISVDDPHRLRAQLRGLLALRFHGLPRARLVVDVVGRHDLARPCAAIGLIAPRLAAIACRLHEGIARHGHLAQCAFHRHDARHRAQFARLVRRCREILLPWQIARIVDHVGTQIFADPLFAVERPIHALARDVIDAVLLPQLNTALGSLPEEISFARHEQRRAAGAHAQRRCRHAACSASHQHAAGLSPLPHVRIRRRRVVAQGVAEDLRTLAGFVPFMGGDGRFQKGAADNAPEACTLVRIDLRR